MRGSSLKKDSILPMISVSCLCHPKKIFTNLSPTTLLIGSLKKSSQGLVLTKSPMNKFSQQSLLFLLGLYRSIGSSFLGGHCRFEPSCSAYAVEVVQTQSFFKALRLILLRLSKCHPWGPYGYDPVPQGQHEKTRKLCHE